MIKAKNRLFIVISFFTLLFGIVLTRVTYLTFLTGSAGHKRQRGVVRGPVLDRRGLTLAVTQEASTIAIAPPELVDAEFTARNLARHLSMSSEEILKRIYLYQDRRYFLLKRQVDNFTADRIVDLHLPGVHREWEYRRYYPGETLASNLIGFVGRDQNRALAGIERVFHEQLSVPESHVSRRGPSLHLTLDSLIQYRLEEAMVRGFRESGSKRATGIVMDLRTGEILAMANFPNFNPNRYWRSTPFQRGNWAIRLNYEPGSTVKIFMASILLQERAMSLRERILCDGEFKDRSVVIRDRGPSGVINYGKLTLEEILQHSSNVGIIKAMQRIPREKLHQYMSRLGFGEKTGVLPPGSGETSGYLPDLEEWVPSTSYYLPIGQGFSVTPIQLLRASASIANGGELVEPYLARKITTSTGEVLDSPSHSGTSNPFRKEVNHRVLQMMRTVVNKGTGWRAKMEEMPIAGKTGTGQKSSAAGYTDQIVASFIGFFPADNPRYGGLILYDAPAVQGSGGSLAAPVFAEFVRSTLPLLKKGFNPESVPLLQSVPEIKPAVNEKRLYDFRGLSAREALSIMNLHYRGVKTEIRGSGYVYRQKPDPGTPMERVKRVTFYLDVE